MNYSKMLAALSDKEKIDLAAKLTQAAMSAVTYEPEPNANTRQALTDLSAEMSYMVFGKLLGMITSGHEPQKFSVRHPQ